MKNILLLTAYFFFKNGNFFVKLFKTIKIETKANELCVYMSYSNKYNYLSI